jgi:zinc finger SWIM domain-containing protein 3
MDATMKAMYEAYPELIMMDATYKLTSDRMAVYLLLAIDGNGESHIVAAFLVAKETRALLQEMMEVFIGYFDPEVVSRTRVIITDKDFTERSVLQSCFPETSLHLCLFHTLWTFSREVTTSKMSIQPQQRQVALSILQRIAYSKNLEECL